MVSRQQIEDLVQTTLIALADDMEIPALADPTPETILFGPGGLLDSLALVHLIADTESRIADELDREIAIADERAMSRSRSPFKTADTFCTYLMELLNEQPAEPS